MSLVPAKCPECGKNVVVDSAKDAWICDFCKMPFIVKKAINHFSATNNITHNIETNVVNIRNGNSLCTEIQRLKDIIELAIKLKDGSKLREGLEELHELKEKEYSNLEMHEAFLEMLIDSYQIAIAGVTWKNFFKQDPLKVLLDELNVIKIIDITAGKQAEKRITLFFNELHSVITTPLDDKNDFASWKGRFEARYGNFGIRSNISILSLARSFIIDRQYPKTYEEIYSNRIKPILDVCKKYYLGFEMIYGRLAVVPTYDPDRGYGNECIMLDFSVTEIEQINVLINKYKHRMSPSAIGSLKDEARRIKWALEDKKCCGCRKKLSILGKCKTPECKYCGKSLQNELYELERKIRIGKGVQGL